MAKCYICGDEITENNKTEEHIILNAIGGKLKPDTLICKHCNSTTGDDIDAALAKQLNHLSNLFNISRDRGNVPNLECILEKDNEEILIQPGGKPILRKPIIKEEIDEKNNIKITVNSPNGEVAKKVIRGLERKYNKQGKHATEVYQRKSIKYLDQKCKISINIGGEKAFRSICKMAVNLYMYKGGIRKYIEHLIPYIQGKEILNCVKFYYNGKNIIYKNKGEVLHSIIIKGDKNQKLLVGYIELFNCYKFSILLNDKYDGENIEYTYYFDVLERKEIEKNNKLNITRRDFIVFNDNLNIITNKIRSELDKVLRMAMKKQQNEKINGIVEQAMENSLGKYPEDVMITSEMIEEFINELCKLFAPWLNNTLN